LVINTWPGRADDAAALVRNLGYSFKLVHAPEGWKHSMGQGANFLIDQQGRVVFRLHFAVPGDLKMANRLIGGLLRYKPRRGPGRTGRIPEGKAGVAGA